MIRYEKIVEERDDTVAYNLHVKTPEGRYKLLNISKSPKYNFRTLLSDYSNAKHFKIEEEKEQFILINKSEKIGKKYTAHDLDILRSKGKTIPALQPKYSLLSIDLFTSQFESEQDLKEHLVTYGILGYQYLNNPVVITYYSNKKEKRNFKPLYMEDQYYFDIETILNIITNRFLNKDFKFLKAMAIRFLNFNECSTTAGELLAAISETEKNGRISNAFIYRDENGDTLVQRLPKLLIYKHENINGVTKYKINDKNGKNWRTFHLLIEFIRDYEAREKEKQNNSRITKVLTPPPKNKEDRPKQEFNQLSFIDFSDY